MLRNLDNASGKILMYPRFIQTVLDKQLDGLPTHKEKYDVSFHIKKFFAKIKRIAKGFSSKEIPLFPTIVGPNQIQIDEAVHKEGDDSLVRATTTASSLEVEQDSGNIDKTQTKATSNEPSSQRTSSGVNIPRSDEDRLKHIELMKIYTTLQKKVLNIKDELKRTKTTQQTKIDGLERRVKKLEKKQMSRAYKLKILYKVGLSARVESSDDEGLGEEDASKQGRIIDNLDANVDITLVNDQEMFDVDKDLQAEEVIVEQEVVVDKEPIVDIAQVSAAATAITIDDITLAKALEALKTSKPKIRRTIIKDHEEPSKPRTTKTISSNKSQDKGKAKMIEEPVKLKKNIKSCLMKKFLENYKKIFMRKKDLLQAKEQQELNEEEKAKLFMVLLEKRRKFFAAKRTKEKKNRSPTKAQQRSLITKLVEESSKKVEEEITQEESSKRAGDELEQETAKKQKIIDDKETANLKQLVKIIPEEDIAINDIPLAVKTLIVD
uniref:Uncharacterized protein n=1 Tax=Tanacetum cinerariifolium TaxID=118510 RepID=A0A699HVK0_TANCI|nr:hypothetical protein [Tanacetum cinerariifolium]